MSFNNPSFLTRQWYYKWHRRIAVASALFVVILLVTGILLNHTEGLQLDSHFSQSSLLRKAYGLPATLDIQAVEIEQRIISQFQDTIYLNEQAIDVCPGDLVGGIALDNVVGIERSLLIACSSGLLWLDSNGEYLDFISVDTFNSASINALGTNASNQPVIDTGNRLSQISLDDLSSTNIESQDVSWSQLQAVDAATAKRLTDSYYREALSWEQIVLDMHSGRLFGGAFGVFLMDASAIILLLLVISGLYMWWVKRL